MSNANAIATRGMHHATAGAMFVFAALAAAGPANAQSNSVNSWGAWSIPPAPAPQAGVAPPTAPVPLPEQARRRITQSGGIGEANINPVTGSASGIPVAPREITNNVQQSDLANKRLPATLQIYLANPQVPDTVKRSVISATVATASPISAVATAAQAASVAVVQTPAVTVPAVTVPPVTTTPVTTTPVTVPPVTVPCNSNPC